VLGSNLAVAPFARTIAAQAIGLMGRGLSWVLLPAPHSGRPDSLTHRVLTVLVVFIAAIWFGGLKSAPIAVVLDPTSHPLLSYEIAFNRSHCGVYPYFSSHPAAIRTQFAARLDVLDIPASQIPERVVGASGDYCATVGEAFLNNENTLALIMFAAFELMPDLSLSDMGQILRGLALAALAVWLVVALALGLSPLLALIALVVALHLETFQWTFQVYAVYPLLLPVALLFATSLVLLARAVMWRRWRALLPIALMVGLLSGFYYNLRTSHAPLIAAGTLLCLWLCLRSGRNLAHWRVAGIKGLLAAILFFGGFALFHRAAVAPGMQFPGRDDMYAYHVIAHPLVLSLALPPNSFAESQGIRWLDRVGLDLARRADPEAVYMGGNYEAALWTFYRNLWRTHPQEMAGVYLLKWQTAGREVLDYIRKQDGPAFLALQPVLLLGNGVGMALLWAGMLAWAAFARRPRLDLALGVGLTAAFGLLLLFESALIHSTWNPFYQSPLVFVLGLSILSLYQMILNGVASMIRNPGGNEEEVSRQTIADFGTQWTTYSDTSGLFGSVELLADFIAPFPIERFRNARVADIGAGTGRHSRALLEAGAAEVIAVEPSRAIEVIRSQVVPGFPGRVTALNCPGDGLPPTGDIDYAISVGVLHHIPEPGPVVAAVYRALKPGGQFVAWLYGKEGNLAYLLLVGLIRPISTRLPRRLAAGLAWILDIPLVAYMALCRWFPRAGLPLGDYLTNVLGHLPGDKRRLVIYDQIKPRYAKYYTQAEALALMSGAPFNVEVHSRRGFSWVVIGTKPREGIV